MNQQDRPNCTWPISSCLRPTEIWVEYSKILYKIRDYAADVLEHKGERPTIWSLPIFGGRFYGCPDPGGPGAAMCLESLHEFANALATIALRD